MKCEICGRDYKRGHCEFCERERRWKLQRGKFREEVFPPRLIRDLQSFEPPPLSDLLQEKEGVYIHGPIGSGKTVLAAMLLEARKKEHWITNIPLSAHFISTPSLLGELRSTFSSTHLLQRTEMGLITEYSEIDWLLLDDLGAEKSTDWALQSLYIIINNRYENLKNTIFTSNLDLDQLAEKLGDDRIPSRIHSMCYIHELKNEDRRLEK